MNETKAGQALARGRTGAKGPRREGVVSKFGCIVAVRPAHTETFDSLVTVPSRIERNKSWGSFRTLFEGRQGV